MKKLVNWEKCETVAIKDKECIFKYVKIPAEYLDLKWKECVAKTSRIVDLALADITPEDNVYVIAEIDKSAPVTKEDVNIVYDMLTMIFTDILVSKERREREYILGEYLIPYQINMMSSYITAWANYKIKCSTFGFELKKQGSLWKKRMVK